MIPRCEGGGQGQREGLDDFAEVVDVPRQRPPPAAEQTAFRPFQGHQLAAEKCFLASFQREFLHVCAACERLCTTIINRMGYVYILNTFNSFLILDLRRVLPRHMSVLGANDISNQDAVASWKTGAMI